METLPNLEVVRSAAIRSTLSTDEPAADTLGKLEVRFSKFGQWYEINSVWEGRFLERVMPGAFTKTIRENGERIQALFNHGFDPSVGQMVLGPVVDLREESDSPVMVVDLMDTSYNRDLLPGLKRGLYGSSMRMKVTKDTIEKYPARSDHNPDGIPERSIHEVAVAEAGPVTFPANPGSTSAMRSDTDAYYEQLRSLDPGKVDELERCRRPLLPDAAVQERTSEIRTEDQEAASNPPVEPANDHSKGLSAGERRRQLNNLPERKSA